MSRSLVIVGIFVLLVAATLTDANAGLRVGGGLHYLRTVGELKDSPGIDENSFGFLASVKFKSGLITVEGDLELIPDYVGSSEMMWQPQGWALVGGLIYGGVGIGIGHLGDFGWQDPFYGLRAGVDFNLGSIDLDAFATYQFQSSEDLSSLGTDDLDSITFGALINFAVGGE